MTGSQASLASRVRRLKGQNLSLDDYESGLLRLAGLDPKPVGNAARSVAAGLAKTERLRDLETRLIALEERVRQLETHT
ncbi:hypothetical protein [Aquibium sp. ELW1220]|uniref:hypothetical protein n=1 Tax=Aquibium sp. ELW1220 TaxID=2976766 RepID=UPI0025B17378|nr:hypothetical protein [Aquibium sp. ELW1220]MDN2583416.1 hypothetical protein [Aquibium sp. ELW1220]